MQYLDAHGPELTGLDLPVESLEDEFHKDGDDLVDIHTIALQDNNLQIEQNVRSNQKHKFKESHPIPNIRGRTNSWIIPFIVKNIFNYIIAYKIKQYDF